MCFCIGLLEKEEEENKLFFKFNTIKYAPLNILIVESESLLN